MIQKNKLIQKIIKAAKISESKATIAYETILKEEASFRKQELKSVEAKVEKAVKVAGRVEIKKVELVKEVPVKTVNTVEKIKVVEVIKEVPVEVVKVVEKIKEVKVIKEVPVPQIKEVIKEVQVIKEVPIEVLKEITLIKEVEVPVEVIKEVKVPVIKEVKIKDEKTIQKLKEVSEELAAYKYDWNKLSKQNINYETENSNLKKELKVKPKVIEKIKEIKVPVVKEVKVEVVKEVKVPVVKEVKLEVVKEVKVPVVKEVKVPVIKEVKVPVVKEIKIKDEKLIAKYNETSSQLSAYKRDYETLYKQAIGYEKEISKLNNLLKSKPKVVEKIKEVPVQVIKEIKVKDEKSIAKYISEIEKLKNRIKEKPKEVVKTVIKEVPVEINKEVEVVKSIDVHQLRAMMEKMKTKEVSKTVVGETRHQGDAVIVQKREVKAGTNKVDDLTKIEGIGPKIAGLLGRKGIYTFAELANTKVTQIQSILDEAGPKYAVHDPGSWPNQSSLAAAGKWDDLKALQDKLLGGK